MVTLGEDVEVEVEEGLLSGVFLFSDDESGWLTTLRSAEAMGGVSLGCLDEGDGVASSSSDRDLLGLLILPFKGAVAAPNILDSIL